MLTEYLTNEIFKVFDKMKFSDPIGRKVSKIQT